jgi:hypothetical protein
VRSWTKVDDSRSGCTKVKGEVSKYDQRRKCTTPIMYANHPNFPSVCYDTLSTAYKHKTQTLPRTREALRYVQSEELYDRRLAHEAGGICSAVFGSRLQC